MSLPDDLVNNLDGPARALATHLDERLDALEAAASSPDAVSQATLSFAVALSASLAGQGSDTERVAVLEALTASLQTSG